jgi:hypothetical protein
MLMPQSSSNFAFMSWSAVSLSAASLPRIDYPIPLSVFPDLLSRGSVH